MKTAVLGTGSWGTALAQILCDNGQDVILWGVDPKQVEDINVNHHNSAYYDDPINPDLKASIDMNCIEDADIILAAVPTMALEDVLTKAAAIVDHPVIVINVAKGFHPVTHDRLSNVIRHIMPADKLRAVVSLIGPSHAEEVIKRKLTAVNAVSLDEEAAKAVQELFSNSYFRVYRNTDEAGAEIGVAVKNIMAIASGILAGIGQGANARAALVTRGLAEMVRFGTANGGKAETYLGLDGVGDLVVTCTSTLSRNFMAGYQIGQDGSAANFWKNNKKTVEGVFACKVVYEEAQKQHIDMPITSAVYAVLYKDVDPRDAITALMSRDLKSEEQK